MDPHGPVGLITAKGLLQGAGLAVVGSTALAAGSASTVNCTFGTLGACTGYHWALSHQQRNSVSLNPYQRQT
jgi:hypothetical protein